MRDAVDQPEPYSKEPLEKYKTVSIPKNFYIKKDYAQAIWNS